jgi:hypothetical protein
MLLVRKELLEYSTEIEGAVPYATLLRRMRAENWWDWADGLVKLVRKVRDLRPARTCTRRVDPAIVQVFDASTAASWDLQYLLEEEDAANSLGRVTSSTPSGIVSGQVTPIV